MKSIVTACPFLNEFQLLKFRVLYMDQSKLIWKHVIIEGNFTHSGIAKPYKLRKFILDSGLEKRVEVVEVDLSYITGSWGKEIFTREFLARYVREKYPESKIILSDLDEIPSQEQIMSFYHDNTLRQFTFSTPTYYRRANWAVLRMKEFTSGLMLHASEGLLPNAGRYLGLPLIPSESEGIHLSYVFQHETSFFEKQNSIAEHELYGEELTKTKKFLDYVDKFKIDHLGCISRAGFGILRVDKHFTEIQLMISKMVPEWIDQTSTPPILLRLWASARISCIYDQAPLPRRGRNPSLAKIFAHHYFGDKRVYHKPMLILTFQILHLFQIYRGVREFQRKRFWR